ncbi:MAG: tRNA (adenosine(37)-N6)-threonylcarbamoyltransferase complex transferase subunit TsaD [Prevotellaceae bacterium]|jgi:N6-L-threonylcarbamoyladenine synthase|nr:tRNA (adenosine(37)-N6)-threonylcarbamoyltransferase complex transferase subunit TsaD [Prevotellaceae bacterium]
MAASDIILGIESSCDDTSAAVARGTVLLSNVIANQSVHEAYGGVVPELASRAHQQHIIPVVNRALEAAQVRPHEVSAVAFTRGPGLIGSLLVGVSFAKGLALATGAPMVEVNHLQGHVMAHFIDEPNALTPHPKFPFLCLLVSGGHTQLLLVAKPLAHEIIGQTIDDAAGEAFDKCAKVMELPYPGGPVVDKLAAQGNAQRFSFAKPQMAGLDYSFSGLKTSFLYFLRDQVAQNPAFVAENKADLCASLQRTIIEILLHKLEKAVAQTGVKEVAIAGGVSANAGLRSAVSALGKRHGWSTYLPPLRYTTDNAAMIAVAGYFKYLSGETAGLDVAPLARM